MLAREQRRRSNNRHLNAGHGRDKCGAQSDFGFAETNIAANKAVTGFARSQIINNIIDRI